MITIENQTPCLICGKAIEQHSPRVQLYCNQACKQRAYRARLAQHEQPQAIDQDAHARIAELEQEVQRLHERLNLEQRYLLDTEARPFKAWLRKRTYPPGSFAHRLLADTRFEKPRYSKAWYEAYMPRYGYSSEDVAEFRDLWKAMLLQS